MPNELAARTAILSMGLQDVSPVPRIGTFHRTNMSDPSVASYGRRVSCEISSRSVAGRGNDNGLSAFGRDKLERDLASVGVVRGVHYHVLPNGGASLTPAGRVKIEAVMAAALSARSQLHDIARNLEKDTRLDRDQHLALRARVAQLTDDIENQLGIFHYHVEALKQAEAGLGDWDWPQIVFGTLGALMILITGLSFLGGELQKLSDWASSGYTKWLALSVVMFFVYRFYDKKIIGAVRRRRVRRAERALEKAASNYDYWASIIAGGGRRPKKVEDRWEPAERVPEYMLPSLNDPEVDKIDRGTPAEREVLRLPSPPHFRDLAQGGIRVDTNHVKALMETAMADIESPTGGNVNTFIEKRKRGGQIPKALKDRYNYYAQLYHAPKWGSREWSNAFYEITGRKIGDPGAFAGWKSGRVASPGAGWESLASRPSRQFPLA